MKTPVPVEALIHHRKAHSTIRHLSIIALVSLLAVFEIHAQQSEVDRKLLAEIRTKAEKGNAQSQFDLGVVKEAEQAAVLVLVY